MILLFPDTSCLPEGDGGLVVTVAAEHTHLDPHVCINGPLGGSLLGQNLIRHRFPAVTEEKLFAPNLHFSNF